MGKVQISVRVDEALKQTLEGYCESRGIAMNCFVQEAIIDRLEEIEDIEDVKRVRREAARPLAEVLGEFDGRP